MKKTFDIRKNLLAPLNDSERLLVAQAVVTFGLRLERFMEDLARQIAPEEDLSEEKAPEEDDPHRKGKAPDESDQAH